MDIELGISRYIDNIDKKDKLIYFTVLCLSMYFGLKINITIPQIVIVILTIFWILYSEDLKVNKNIGSNRQLETKLKLLDKKIPSYFHLDPDIINLFFSIKDFKKINPDAFKKAMQTTDNVLRLRSDMEKDIENSAETFEIAQDQATKSLNYMQSFIISIPGNPVYVNKFEDVLERHHILLKRSLDVMFERYKELNKDVNISTKFLTYGGPKGSSPESFGALNFNLFV